MFGHFYYSQLRTYALLMANLFNNISVKRNNELIKVPITYGSKEAFLAKIDSLMNQPIGEQNPLGIETILPRMNVQLIDVIYDGQAKTRTTSHIIVGTQNQKPKKQYNMWPMKVTYELNIQTKNQNDMYQILEQIFPYFTPYFISEIREKFTGEDGDFDVAHKVPIELLGISPDEQQAAGPNERRRLEWSIQFSLRGYLYPPNVQIGNLIKSVYLDFRGSMNSENQTFETMDYQIKPIESEINQWEGELVTGTGNNENFKNSTTKVPRGKTRNTKIEKEKSK